MTATKAVVGVIALTSFVGAATPDQPSDTTSTVGYQFSIHGIPVARGVIWMYYEDLDIKTYTLSQIVDGKANVRFTTDIAREQMHLPDPDRTEDLSVGAIVEVPGVGWYKTPDLKDPVSDLVSALDHLGVATIVNDLHTVDLSPPAGQTFLVLNADGTPRPNFTIRVSTYLGRFGHCGRWVGFGDWRELKTDRRGMASFVAPLSTLLLGRPYFEEEQRPEGRALTPGADYRLDARTEHTLRRVWARAPERTFRLRVVKSDGTPSHAELWQREEWDSCETPTEHLGVTDARGEMRVQFAPEHAEDLWLANPDHDVNDPGALLTGEERAKLFRSGSLTIVWPR